MMVESSTGATLLATAMIAKGMGFLLIPLFTISVFNGVNSSELTDCLLFNLDFQRDALNRQYELMKAGLSTR